MLARGDLHPSWDRHERFLPDPLLQRPGARLFRTGDRGRWLDDGNIEYRGRNDDLVKIDGLPVELSELESTLQEIPRIKHCAVTVRSDARGPRFLLAHVELDGTHDDLDAVVSSIAAAARAKLPAHMVPREIRRISQMPLTLSGKIDRKRLARFTGILKAEGVTVRQLEELDHSQRTGTAAASRAFRCPGYRTYRR